MEFVPGYDPPSFITDEDLWFAFCDGNILVDLRNGKVGIPHAHDLLTLQDHAAGKQYIGMLNGRPCYAIGLMPDCSTPEGMDFRGLRGLYSVLCDEVFWIAGRALQISTWDLSSRYCGRCGSHMDVSGIERAKVCPACGFKSFPRISPAVIVAVTKGNRILLARSYRFPVKIYSVIAGFVEPGETLEECIKREIEEEVGLQVKNIRYFGSQPWPFPNSLMIAFTAEYAGGVLQIDDEEIMDAGWYAADALPPVPDKISVARRLIDWFVEKFTDLC
jgi:NAD+ diphosphatase